MSRKGWYGLGAAAALCIALQSHVWSQAQPQSPEEMQKLMEKYAEAMKPGEHHKKLDGFVGTWDVKIRMWYAGPDGPVAESTGVAESKWILGKRFVQDHFKGEFLMPTPDGQVNKEMFEGIGMTGYDGIRNVYIGNWADSMSTMMLHFKGSMSQDGKTLTMYAEMDEPMSNVYGRMIRSVTRWVDADTYVFTMYDLHAGDNHKVMELTYKRRK